MPDNGNRYQIVFLVDVSLGVTEPNVESDLLKTLNQLRFTVLRLLTCLASSTASTSPSSNRRIELQSNHEVQWGYKFYNSRFPGSQTAKYGFRDFNIKNLEEFENELENRLEKERTQVANPKAAKQRLLPKLEHHVVHTETRNTPGNPTPVSGMAFGSEEWEEEAVDKLKRCLMDIVHEFQWDRPVISSPVKLEPKRRRQGKSTSHHEREENKQHNLIFLYSKCPQTLQELQAFCDRPADVSSVLASFLPPQLQRQWCDILQLQLFWLDMGCFAKTSPSTDFGGVEMMHRSLQLVNGCVVPVSAFLQPGGLTTTLVQSCLSLPASNIASPETGGLLASSTEAASPGTRSKQDHSQDSESCPMLFSVSNLMSFYMCQRRPPSKSQDKLTAYLVHYQGTEKKTLCQVQIQSLTLTQNRSPLARNIPTSSRDSSAKSTLPAITCELHKPYTTNPSCATVRDCGSPCTTLQVQGKPLPPDSARCPLYLLVLGALPSAALPLSSFESGSESMVLPSGEEMTSLPELLMELARQNLVLVCDCADPRTATPALCVLRPLTMTSATLILVRSDLAFLLEKLLCFSCERKETGVDSFVKLHSGHAIKKVEPGSHLLDSDETASISELGRSAPFDCRYLESWYNPQAIQDVNAGLLHALSDSPSPGKPVQKEATILKKMQKCYIRTKSQRLSITLPEVTSVHHSHTFMRRTPRKAQHISPEAPSKTRARTPKRCPGTSRLRGRTPKKSLSQLRKTPRKSSGVTPRKATRTRKMAAQGKLVDGGQAQLTKLHRRSSSMRGQEILERSRQALASKKDKEEGKERETGKVAVTVVKTELPHESEVENLDLNDEASLLEYTQDIYDKAVMGTETGLLTAVGSMLLCVQLFFKRRQTDSVEATAADWLERNFVKDPNHLKEKYKAAETDTVKEEKCQEYQMQVLLHMDAAIHTVPQCCQPKKVADDTETDEDEAMDAKVTQLVTILGRMSFLKNPTFLSTFLNATLLPRYLSQCPYLLGKIYEELLQPLPPALELMLSQETEDSLASVCRPQSNTSAGSSVPTVKSVNAPTSDRVLRDRKLIRHPTFHDIPQRQISVNLPKAQPQESRRGKASGQKPKRKAEPEFKTVRRNLFTSSGRSGVKLDRRQSLAVMEGVKTATSTPKKQTTQIRQPKTPKSHHVLKTRSVAETPAHKQKLNQVWRRQEKERRRAHTVADVAVVTESPDKILLKGQKVRKSPRRSSLQFARRSSFYADGPGSKSRAIQSMEHFQRLEARMKGQPLLSPTWKEKHLLRRLGNSVTPSRRITPKSLFAGIIQPSPDKAASMSTLSPDKLSAWAKQAQFDSPSRNTRKRALFLSPEREPMTLHVMSPVQQSPKSQTKMSGISLTPVGQAATGKVHDITPRKARRSLTDKLQGCNADPLSGTHKLSRFAESSQTKAADMFRQTAQRDAHISVPDNMTNPVFTSPLSQENVVVGGRGALSFEPSSKGASHKQVTRLQTMLLGPSGSQGYMNPAFAIGAMPNKDHGTASETELEAESVENMISPRRYRRLQSPTSHLPKSPCLAKQTSPPAPREVQQECRAPSSLHSSMLLSPRRSVRLGTKSTPDQETLEAGKVQPSDVKNVESDCLKQEVCSAPGDQAKSVTSADLDRSKSKPTDVISGVDSDLSQHNQEAQTLMRRKSLVRASSKGKLCTDGKVPGTSGVLRRSPLKRQCTHMSSTSSVSSSGQLQSVSYFDSPEVFASKSPSASSPPTSFPWKRESRRSLLRKGASLESNSESNLDYPAGVGSNAFVDENSNSQSSATFPGLTNKQWEKTRSSFSGMSSDSEMSRPDSPVFPSPNCAAAASPGSSRMLHAQCASTTTPQHKLVVLQDDESPLDFKKFSPTISRRSLQHLIQSPLVPGASRPAQTPAATSPANSSDSDDSVRSPKRSWKFEKSEPPTLWSECRHADSNDSVDGKVSPKRSRRSERSQKGRSRRSLYS